MIIKSWGDSTTTEETNVFVRILARRHLARIESAPVRDVLTLFVESSDFANLCRYEPDYDSLSLVDAQNVRQVLAFYSKREDLDIGVDRRRVARESFVESERRCLETNTLFRQRSVGNVSFPLDVEGYLYSASRVIARVLGELPPLAALKPRFGPGATTTTKKSEASARRKLADTLACSGEFAALAPEALGELPGLLGDDLGEDPLATLANEYQRVSALMVEVDGLVSNALDEHDRDGHVALCAMYDALSLELAELRELLDKHGMVLPCTDPTREGAHITVVSTASVPVEIHAGKLSFVPKNAKTDRGIVVEPVLNTMYQLGIGDYIVARLLAFGVDLQDQSKNQSLACLGSLTGALATLDLKMASDLIADAVVADLLPPDWYLFLSKLRSGTIQDKELGTIRLQKFSSMGNGYTFALESLIFYGLCRAVCGDHSGVSVYGDDLIVPTEDYETLVKVLHHCGFVVNETKSFATGVFRESCGADFFSGIDIRPRYIKGPLTGESLYGLHNYYVAKGDEQLAQIVLWGIPIGIRNYGPAGYGDGHLHGVHPMVPHNLDRGWSGYLFGSWKWVNKYDYDDFGRDGSYACYHSYMRQPARVPFETSDSKLRYSKHGRLGISIPGHELEIRMTKIYVLSDFSSASVMV